MTERPGTKIDLLTFEDLLDADWGGVADILKAEALRSMKRRFKRATSTTTVGPWGLEDIAMSALVDAYKKWRPVDMDFVSYARRRVRNLTQTIWRSPDYNRRSAIDVDLLSRAVLSSPPPDDPRLENLFEGFSGLPPKHRAWILAVYQDDGSHPLRQQEIAEKIGVSNPTSSRIRRALATYITHELHRRQSSQYLKARPGETPEWCCPICGKLEWMWVERNPGFTCQCQRCGADAMQAVDVNPYGHLTAGA